MSDELTLKYLRRARCCSVPGLSNRQALEAVRHLKGCSVYRNCHVAGETATQSSWDVARDDELISHGLADILRTPYLMRCALQHHPLAAAYLEVDRPTLYSANVFWTRPGPTIRPDLNELHQDPDDVRFIVLFIYLTDILEVKDGPHVLRSPEDNIHTFFGPAGAAFLSDTSNPHRGLKPTRGERGIFWTRWGISQIPYAYSHLDKTKPVPRSQLGDVDYDARDPRLHMLIKGDE